MVWYSHLYQNFLQFIVIHTVKGWTFPYPGDLPDPGIEPGSPALQVDPLPTKLSGNICVCIYIYIYMNATAVAAAASL